MNTNEKHNKLYFVTTFSLKESAKQEYDSESEEFKKAYKNRQDYSDKIYEARNKLESKYPEFEDWLGMRCEYPPEDPYTSDLYLEKKMPEDADYMEWPPEDLPRPSKEERNTLAKLIDDMPDFFENVPLVKIPMWKLATKRTVGYFTDLETAKDIIESNGNDWEECGYYDMAVIEAIGPGMYSYSAPEDTLFYSCDEGWIQLESGDPHLIGSYSYKGILIDDNIGIDMG